MITNEALESNEEEVEAIPPPDNSTRTDDKKASLYAYLYAVYVRVCDLLANRRVDSDPPLTRLESFSYKRWRGHFLAS